MPRIKKTPTATTESNAVINGECGLTINPTKERAVATLKHGDNVVLISRDNDYAKIKYNNVVGYVPTYKVNERG